MLGQQAKGEINLLCTEQALPEFPNLLFGTQAESGISYFDATDYLQKQLPEQSIQNFFAQYKKPIESLCEAHDIALGQHYKINQAGHYLIDGNLVYLFIAFTDPHFLGYMCDRIHEIFTQGVSVSDTYLLHAAGTRLSKTMIQAMIKDGEQGE